MMVLQGPNAKRQHLIHTMNLKGIKITWLGHATFRVETPGGRIILIDPWVMGNPACPTTERNVKKVDVMLCTHGHFDHIGDAVEIAKKHNPKVVGIPELCGWLGKKGVKQTAEMNKGGTQTVEDIKVTMVHADHSCGIKDGDELVYGGEACGYVVEFSNGVKIYHAGDTNVFGDMKIIRELYAPEIAMIPIGDHYTMGPREAAYACNLLKPKTVIPMHFGTFPPLVGRPSDLKKLVPDMEIREMKPGETIT
jgi:L-ascorbate metabolism protein UlaG (beta-lactamase superfamily)